jgi:hypothetical protein
MGLIFSNDKPCCRVLSPSAFFVKYNQRFSDIKLIQISAFLALLIPGLTPAASYCCKSKAGFDIAPQLAETVRRLFHSNLYSLCVGHMDRPCSNFQLLLQQSEKTILISKHTEVNGRH